MDDAKREAIRDMLRRRAEERTRTPEMARQWLIDEGLYEGTGELKPQCGGQANPDEDA